MEVGLRTSIEVLHAFLPLKVFQTGVIGPSAVVNDN